jgi:hypothetical protein
VADEHRHPKGINKPKPRPGHYGYARPDNRAEPRPDEEPVTLPPKCKCGDYLGQGDCPYCRHWRGKHHGPDDQTRRALARTNRDEPEWQGTRKGRT